MQISDLELVVRTAELGSITAAAEAQDMRVAAASAAIKRVEKQLGHQLFVRSTRRLRLTQEGERYIHHCAQALEGLQTAQQSLLENDPNISGELRLTVSSDLGRNLVAPLVDEIMDAHPNLTLKLVLGDAIVDFFRDPVDVGIRYGRPEDASLYGFQIAEVPRLMCASTEYLQRYGIPSHPEELSQHNGLFFMLRGQPMTTWLVGGASIKMAGNRVSNDADMVRRWCVAGKGIAQKSALDMSDDLLRGRIKALLPNHPLPPIELWLLTPSRQVITPGVRLLRDSLMRTCEARLDALAKADYWV